MFVDIEYYATVYQGQEADMDSFPALCARAEDVVCAMTRWQVTDANFDALSPLQRCLVKKAVCAQIDSFAVNGLDSVTDNNENGFTVGKVRIGGDNSIYGSASRKGKMESHVSPLTVMYLEQSGLMCPAVPAVQGAIV